MREPHWSVSPSYARHTLQWLLVTLAALAFSSSCTKEPCEHSERLHPPAETTPFAGGKTVFSVCAPCPVLMPSDNPGGDTGPATICQIGFTDSWPNAFVACFYGPDG